MMKLDKSYIDYLYDQTLELAMLKRLFVYLNALDKACRNNGKVLKIEVISEDLIVLDIGVDSLSISLENPLPMLDHILAAENRILKGLPVSFFILD